ncbi:MAG: class I SAM-dependent methyltransferase [Gemmatimonadetes bacterium]|nr:class I SAM-dependent methyltransferase [Gemmatimonadota bacterium]
MSKLYDPRHIAEYFDSYGEREWDRLVSTAYDRVNFEMHVRVLARHVHAGDRVLEAGAGAGRFTIELARLGASLTVADISPEQVRLNEANTRAAGAADGVEAWAVADACDLSRYPAGSFDAAIGFGGLLSYALDRRDDALEELLRVTKPGGPVLLSVIALLGGYRLFLPAVLAMAAKGAAEALATLRVTGDQVTRDVEPGGHFCHMFRWTEFEAFLHDHRCEVAEARGANFASVQNATALEGVWESAPEQWKYLLDLEEDFTAEPGAIDSATHMIAVVRRD